ncbi:hypothetical protein FDP41_006177 [Naegleria fowleri]|uniref:RGS domain-containing protein n=1 Tax=Naegleria fowleri TaxID=5763 RepID=A0A6A5B8X5_NAEFO|nr:uncharacterized protein FDP41_006177 [Naegleria fowleri]KAF0974703.1 hypothetical protein FDP41_006177 [Naegleria fowleri]CAG4711443.1 unnamed protein product [Naegleria fowleri]
MGNLYSKNHHQEEGENRWHGMGYSVFSSFRRRNRASIPPSSSSSASTRRSSISAKQQKRPSSTKSSAKPLQNSSSWLSTTTTPPLSLTTNSFPSSNPSHTSHSLQSLSHSNTLMMPNHQNTSHSADSSMMASTSMLLPSPFISSSIIVPSSMPTTFKQSSLTTTSQHYSRFTISSTNTVTTEIIESPPLAVNNVHHPLGNSGLTTSNNNNNNNQKRCPLSRQSFSLPKCRSWIKDKTTSFRNFHLRRRSTTEDRRSTITGVPLIPISDNTPKEQPKNGVELSETHVINSNTNTDVSTGVCHATTGTDTREVNRSNESIERSKRVYSISNLSAASADSWSSSGNVLQRAEESETTMSFDQKDDRRKLASILQNRITRSKSEFSKPSISQEVTTFGDDSSPQRIPVARSSSAPSIINNELDALLRDAIGYQLFKDFCESEYSVENLKFWNELQDMEKNFIDMSGKRRSRVINMVYDKFLDENSTEEVNVRGKTKKLIDQERKSGNIDLERGCQLIHELKRDLYINMIDSFSRFHRTEEYRLWKELKENPENTFEF